ncbi:MAG: hypothetical protein ABIO46_12145 [Chitinophagales bacterium]
MISKILLSMLVAILLQFQFLKAQEKLPVSISVALGYPVSFGDNTLESTTSLFGFDVNAQFPISKKFSFGPSYRVSIYGDKVKFTDENGQVTREDFYSSILNHVELLSEYHLRLSHKLNLRLGMAAGYSFLHVSQLYNYLPGKSPKGFDISPGTTLQFSLSEHVALSSSVKYTFTKLTFSRDVGGTTSKMNENVHETTFAIGGTYLF